MALRPADHGVVASSAGGVTDFYTYLAETTVSNSSTTTISIWPQASWDDYDDLLIVTKTGLLGDTNARNHRMWMNSATSNYNLAQNGWRVTGGNPQRWYRSSDRYAWMNETCPGTANSNSWGFGQIRVAMHKGADSDNVKPGVLMRMSARNGDSGLNYLDMHVVQWNSMSGGVSRIDIKAQYDNVGDMNFRSGSKFTVYGLSMQG